MAEKNIIQKYISFYTTNQIAQRGTQLYKSGAIKSIVYDDKTDTYSINIKGTKLYRTRVSGILKGDISTSCTCPFDWGTVCKHSVAALLYINDNGNKDIPLATVNNNSKETYRRSDEPVKITDYKNITESIVKEYSATSSFNSVNDIDRYIIEDINISKYSVIFTLHEYQYYQNFIYKVTFKFNNNVIEVLTTQNTKIKSEKLRQTEIFCLLIVSRSGSPNFFDLVFDEKKQEKLKEATTSKYGLKLAEFDNFFRFEFDVNKGFLVLKKEGSYGLLPVNGENPAIKEFINSVSDEKNEISFIVQTKKDLVVTFSLMQVNIERNKGVKYIYVPIVAKPNKTQTRLLSRFNLLDAVNVNDVVITKEQEEIIKLIEDFEKTEETQQFNISKQIFSKLTEQQFIFTHYAHHYKYSAENFKEIHLYQNYANIIINVYNDGKFLGVELKVKINDEIIGIDKIDVKSSDSKMLFYNNALHHIASYKEHVLYNSFSNDIKIIKEHKDEFFKNVIQPLSKNYEINFTENTFISNKVELDFKTSQVYISEQDDYIIFQPQVVYDNNVTVLLSSNANSLYKNEETGELVEYVRNIELENDFLNIIASLHPNFNAQISSKFFYLHIDDFTNNLWFYKFFDKLNAQNIEIYGLKDLKNFKYSPHKGKISTSIKSGQDWFDVDINLSFGDYNVSIADIKKAVINKQKYIQLKDGSVGIMPEEWINKLEKYFRNGTVKNDKLEISKLRYSVIDELFDNIDDAKIIEELAEKRKRIYEFKEINKTTVPKQIKAELRHYQKEGVNWINFLDEMKWGGILADDMGLGKTLQILTFIQQIIIKDKTPNLIIVPTTLLFNWKAEIEKFAPQIKAFYHYGVDRNKTTKEFNKYHIIFTSYGVLLRDIENLSKFQFNYLILDESQAIKNPASHRFKASNLIKAKNRIALTGTPIENNTFDLYAQMSFVNPGIFGSINNFKQNYSTPIDKDGNEVIANELQKIINPFVLRRTKEKVAKELPAKTEGIIYCEMEPEQQKIYDTYRNEYRNKLLGNIAEQGIGKSKMMVLEGLTRLRQICDSPSLISDVNFTNQSIKVKEIINNITHRTVNHKVLVFSQFVGMLSLIKTELDKLNISYEYLDGKNNITQRENSVSNFQTDDDLRVFLISLKAGGTGLNLTAADYVYIVDPWWNPAVENQAIDRCYRIGQEKKVFAYRMICKNTVEEKILDLQAKKKKIASDIIQTDENIMKSLTVNDIKDLFG